VGGWVIGVWGGERSPDHRCNHIQVQISAKSLSLGFVSRYLVVDSADVPQRCRNNNDRGDDVKDGEDSESGEAQRSDQRRGDDDTTSRIRI
jgi:protocatechuate 3,4-dioxygenase beta subunit